MGGGSVRGGGLGLGLGRAAAADRTLAGAHALAPLPQEVRGAGVGYLIIDEYQVGKDEGRRRVVEEFYVGRGNSQLYAGYKVCSFFHYLFCCVRHKKRALSFTW